MSATATLNDYKLSRELVGHSKDVRSVACGPDFILSASRDKTAKLWKLKDNEYVNEITVSDHKNFVSVVYYNEEENWICTGSNDNTVCIYKMNDVVPFATLHGHESTVCAITRGLQPGTIFSGSWDQTGRIWRVNESGGETTVILKGHEGAVWAVATLSQGWYVTGSADKNIFVWNSGGEKLHVLKGHTDCVRGLIALSDGSLISCSNDASIKHWNSSGECVADLYGHSNYIYSIALNPSLGDDIIVSASEDSTIRMWSMKDGNLGDSLTIPAESVWSVCCLKNGDIVAGSSDGVIRIFTKDPARIASESVIKEFDLAVQRRILEADKTLGGIKRTQLPGPETLLQPGKDGQTKMVRHPDGKVNCYQWSENRWNSIGEVMGASGGTAENSGKTLYEGQEYDYVFNVDISDDTPPIKLPYNRGDDPWLSAQQFIHKNNLPQVYLDQVANFVIKNANAANLPPTNSGYQDPFTGTSRYIPGSHPSNVDSTGNVDPFTGNSSYTTSGSQKNVQNTRAYNKHFPCSECIVFANCDPDKVYNKLKEFNAKAKESNCGVQSENLLGVKRLMQKDMDVDTVTLELLTSMLKWPNEILFPVLDVARMAVREDEVYKFLHKFSDVTDMFIKNLQSSPANQLMSMRGLVNILKHESGVKEILLRLQSIVDILAKISEGSANLQIALSSLLLNLSISQIRVADNKSCIMITHGLIDFLKWCSDWEACYRAMQALGNLSCTPFGVPITALIVSADLVCDKIRGFASQQISGYEKLSECASAFLQTF